MKKIQRNLVLKNIKDNVDFRILYISYDYNDTVCIELNNKKALPYCDNISNIESQISNNELEIIENDPYYKIFDENTIQNRYLIARDISYEYIKELCSEDSISKLYNKNFRSNLITSISKKFHVTKTTIYKNLRLYLQGGMTKNSLLSQVKTNRNMNYSIKTGRKRSVTQGEGIIIDDNVLLHIKNIYDKYYKKVKGSTIKSAYYEFLYQYYSYQTIENGRIIRKILDDNKIPTFRQFTYHLNKIRNIKDEIIDKIGIRKYQQTERPTLSREDINIFGPGQLYEIDSTISDIYLTSNLSRNIIVGKATLYIIIDVYSRLITGFYTGFEESSWIAAMMAYMNMNENKVEFCKEYDININEKEWPSYGIPAKINADRGETISKASDELVKHLNINIENNPPHCPEMKGIIERWFDTINDYLKRYVPGGVRKDHQQRGGEDYRKKAVLNIREFEKLIITFILKYNNTILESFPMSKDMIDNQVIPIPSNIWNYGAAEKLLFTSSIPLDKMKLALMPKVTASVQRGGICFHKLYYSCETGIRKNWFLKESNGPKTVDIAIYPKNLNKIYIYDKKTMQYEICNMLPKSAKDYKDISLDELLKIRSYESKLKKLNNTNNITTHINYNNQLNEIINNAVKKSAIVAHLSKDKIKNISVNKIIEKAIMRKEESFKLDSEISSKNTTPVSLNKHFNKPLSNDEITYEEHVQKQHDEMNALLQKIISENK